MNAGDPVAVLFASVDQPVAPRRVFAESLLQRLLVEMSAPPAGRAVSARNVRFDWRRVLPRRSWQIAVAIVLVLLLLAGVATATYLAVRTWVSAGPAGSQVASDYRLGVAFAPPRPTPPRYWEYTAFALAPDGHDLYTARVYPDRGELEVLRIRGIDTVTPSTPVPILDARRLADQKLWSPATPALSPPSQYLWPLALSIGHGGEAFLLMQAVDRVGRGALGVDDSLVVLRHNGELQKVVTLRELERSGAVRRWPEPYSLTVVSTAPDRLWLKVDVFGHPVVDSWPASYYTGSYKTNFGTHELFEIVDPNADGDWSDRVVRRLSVPRAIPLAPPTPGGQNPWRLVQIGAEPESARSLLVTLLSTEGQFRVYRLADSNGDGDMRDTGEAQLIFHRHTDTETAPVIASLGSREGRPTPEMAIGGLSRSGRVAIVAESGSVREIARSLPYEINGLLAGPDQRIYPIFRIVSSAGGRWPVYRLEPTTRATKAAQTTVGPKVTRTEACQSAGGRKVAFYSNAESPNESFLYVANTDGSESHKITDRAVDVVCPFTERWLLLSVGLPTGSATRLIRHDLRSGREREIAHDVPRLAMAPDGTRVVYAGGLDFSGGTPPAGRETLEFVDLRTLDRHRLAGPLKSGSYNPVGYFDTRWPLEWSPDGRRIAYVTGPSAFRADPSESVPAAPPARYDLWIRSIASRAPTLRVPLLGGPPQILWSPDGTKVLVCVENSGRERGCAPPLIGSFLPMNPGRLLLVDLTQRSVQLVARGSFVFASWAPAGKRFAYGTPRALFVQTPGRSPTRIATSPDVRWPAGMWRWEQGDEFLVDPSGKRWPTTGRAK